MTPSVDILWPATNPPCPLLPGEVHIWAWRLSTLGPDEPHLYLLDHEELVRYGRLRFADDRARFAQSHGNLRRVLGAYLGEIPGALSFATDERGKPHLAGHALHFNLSHSRQIGAVAVAKHAPLGLDVEDIRPIEPEVAESHFSGLEQADLRALHGDAWLEGFYHCWTRKEAILKAEGAGLAVPLDAFDVTLLPGQPAALRGFRSASKLSRHWYLANLEIAQGARAALAIAEAPRHIRCFRLAHD